MPFRILCAVVLLVGFSGAASFDPPRTKKTVDLGVSRSSPDRHSKINCYFYATFMVKELDLGEKGAARLAIVPIKHRVVPPCTRTKSKTEMVVNPDDWSGYFKGVKGDLVFFDADDGSNGGMPFAIYDSHTGKKIFEDSALGSLEFLDAPASQISFRYKRVLENQCVLPKDPGGCWAQIQKTIGLENATMPDCKKGYEDSAQNLAKGRCQAQNTDTPQCLDKEIPLARDQTKDANTVISYPVDVTLSPKPTITPLKGELGCWPSD